MADARVNNPILAASLTAAQRNKVAEVTLFANAHYLAWHFAATLQESMGDGDGDQVDYTDMAELEVDTNPLPEDDNPDPVDVSDSEVTIEVEEYGLPLQPAKSLFRKRGKPRFADIATVVANHMAKKQDLIASVTALGGSNVNFADSAANAAAMDVTNIMDVGEFIRAAADLDDERVPVFASGYWRAFLHARQYADLFADGDPSGFLDRLKYADPNAFHTGSVGTLHGFEIIKASQGNKVEGGADGGDRDAYKALFCGARYMGYAQAEAPHLMPMREANDSLQRFLFFGWKGEFGYGRVREAHGVRCETAATTGN